MDKRRSGLLLHLTSLPAEFGIGDMGPSAYEFVDFLNESGQTLWALLPINPIGKHEGFAPYGPYSAFAGNPLLVSPELLYRDAYERFVAESEWLDDYVDSTLSRGLRVPNADNVNVPVDVTSKDGKLLKFTQFPFFTQWEQLRRYANDDSPF
jgi:4-alpha-glucanotransferase